MGLLRTLERMFGGAGGKAEQVDLKEIVCKVKGEPMRTFRTAAVGCEYTNPDGSDRQETLRQIKEGQRVRLLVDENKHVVYLVRQRHSGTQQIAMPDCFGRLDDKVAADVIRWVNRDNVVTAAHVSKIVGGTRKRPKLGCVLELSTYPGPEKK